jgi:Protein of unknown function (DUF751)
MLYADLAAGGEEDFWGNVGAYIRFFVTVMLGTVNVVSQPFRKVTKSWSIFWLCAAPCSVHLLQLCASRMHARTHCSLAGPCCSNGAHEEEMCLHRCRRPSGLRRRLLWLLVASCCSPLWQSQ